MNVSDVMSRDVVTARPETSLKEVARLMSTYGISGLPVIDEDAVVLGVVSEADFLIKGRGASRSRRSALERILGPSEKARAHQAKVDAATAAEMMSTPALTIEPTVSLRQAAAIMVERAVNRLPVTRDGRLVGIVTRADLVRAYLRSDDEIRRAIRDDIVLHTLWIAPEMVEVEVVEGVVHLQGMLDRRSTVDTLVNLVRRLEGVVRVDPDLRWQLDDSEVRLPEEDRVARGYPM